MKNLVCSDLYPCTSGSGLYLCLHHVDFSIVIRRHIYLAQHHFPRIVQYQLVRVVLGVLMVCVYGCWV